MKHFVVEHATLIAQRGTTVFFVGDPEPLLQYRVCRVRVIRPDGVVFEAVAHVEAARKVPPGEGVAFRFLSEAPASFPRGSRVEILEAIEFSPE